MAPSISPGKRFPPGVGLRAIRPHADDDVARAVLAVQRAAYAVEAELIGDDRIPPMHEGLAELRGADLVWIGAFSAERLVGAAGWSVEQGELDIERLVVCPTSHRRGIGSALVREALVQKVDRSAVVSTGRDNWPARALYERLGFGVVGEAEALPGLWVVTYRHP